jgi:UDP-glucose:(heptosyl)LPS alpha-1,3-glucosyltransferase
LGEGGVDLVHSMTVAYPGDLYHPHAGVYAEIHEQAIASRPTGAKARFKRLMLQLSPKQRTLIGMERRAAKELPTGVRKILSICLMMTEQFQRAYGVGSERFVLLENPRMGAMPDISKQAEDRAWFRGHYGLKENDRVALFVGHDFRRKGLKWAIDAMAATKTNWKLVVAGLGKVREYVEHVERAGLSERVKFIGPTREMGKVYAAGDALLLPTFYDSFGLVVVEALAHGIPVVSTEFLGAADLVRRNEVGTIVKSPREVSAMAAALDGFPADGNERAELAARCRRAAEGMPGEKYVERVIEIYHSIIAEKKLSE